MLTAADPYATARRLADEIDADLTPDVLIDSLPADATVCVVGWPDLAGEAILRRGDIRDVYANAAGIVLGALTALTPARSWLLALDRRFSPRQS